MGYRTRKKHNDNVIAAVICIIAIILDAVLVFVLKDKSPKFRWLWLPLISCALTCVACGSGALFTDESVAGSTLGFISIAWGVIRGVIVVIAHFNATTGFWAAVGTVFLCIFMWLFNAMPFIIGGSIINHDDSETTSTPSPNRSSERRYESTSTRDRTYAKSSYSSGRSSLTEYFSSSCCAPQSGSIYFWSRYPSISGGGYSYTISGTLGIKVQSIETFNVSNTDMEHYLRAVARDIDSYAKQIVREYRGDHPDDTTDFGIHISLNIDIIN